MLFKLLRIEYATPRFWLQTQLFVSSLLPVFALLVLSAFSIGWTVAAKAGTFVFIFILCSLATFVGNLVIALLVQRVLSQHLMLLTTICQSFVSGDRDIRVSVQGTDEFTRLAVALNRVLESETKVVDTPMANLSSNDQSNKDSPQLLYGQLDTLLKHIGPLMKGDLRTRASVAPGIVGVVADTINYLIEELVQLIRRVQSGADHVVSATRDLLDRAIELAQSSENQMLYLSRTTERIETTTAFIQHLARSIQLCLDTTLAMQSHIQQGREQVTLASKQGKDAQTLIVSNVARLTEEEKQVATTENETINLLELLEADVQRQRDILEEVSLRTEENTAMTETMVTELYTLARHTHEAAMEILNAAERISSLAVIAREWRDSVANFSIP